MTFSHFSQNEVWIGNACLIIITLVYISIACIANCYPRIIITNSIIQIHNHPVRCSWSVVKVSILHKTGFSEVYLPRIWSIERWINHAKMCLFVSICQKNHQTGWEDRVVIRFRWHIGRLKCQFKFNNHTAGGKNRSRTSANQIEFFRWVYFWPRNVQFKA